METYVRKKLVLNVSFIHCIPELETTKHLLTGASGKSIQWHNSNKE
jgi:hypothetical protein